MKVLVTGGAGFIGYHLSKKLADEGNEVVICDNFSRGKMDGHFRSLIMQDNVEYLDIDLRDNAELHNLRQDFDIIYHLAAVNGTKNFYERPHEVLATNIRSLMNILNWIQTTQHKRMVWTSSSETYAGTPDIPIPTPEDVPLTISDVTNPRFSYAGSKIAGELLCLSYAKAYELDISIVRPHNIYGPRMGYDHVIPEFFSRILQKENPFKVYGGNQTRAFCFIDDFVRGLQLIGKHNSSTTEIFNLGDDREEISIYNLARMIFELTRFYPEWDSLAPPAGSTPRRCPDISKVKQLGYSPIVSLVDGLTMTYEWYRK